MRNIVQQKPDAAPGGAGVTDDRTSNDVAALLPLADRIQGHARRLENLAVWRDVLQRNFNAQAAGEHRGMAALLRDIQASRFAGTETDVGFFIVCQMAESHAETIFDTDPELKELSDTLSAIEQREGLDEFDEFDPDHPETPADWKALSAELNRREEEVVRINDDRVIGWLLRHGEPDMADLYAKDRAAYDRRREAGCCIIYGPLPDANADFGEGNTELTQAATEDK